MILHSSHDTPPAVPVLAAPHSSDCATSADAELMRRADDARAKYYANYRKSVIAASGEVVS